ncbi:MAG: hypothetical protein RIB67_01350 [Miltoncostaeaceae bacterium]
MATIIQIRGVPDEVRDALAEAAAHEGLSLSAYARRELTRVAGRAARARANAEVIQRTQRDVGGAIDRRTILEALHEGRGD